MFSFIHAEIIQPTHSH